MVDSGKATRLAGVLAIDKPSGLTSHDVVAAVRRSSGVRRVGHAGTLDPMATGLLLVLVGGATRLERYLSASDKRYEARITFGSATDTLDADGTVVSTADVPDELFDTDVAARLLRDLLGASSQTPPQYSAIKTDGVPAYRRARAGGHTRLAPRPIVVNDATLLGFDRGACTWDVMFDVSKGTYVRALARDLGETAGTVAHLSALRRMAIGTVTVDEALGLDHVVSCASQGRLGEHFIDPLRLLDMTPVTADPHTVANGCPITPPGMDTAPGTAFAIADTDRLHAVYRFRDGMLRAETVFPEGVSR